MPFELTAGRIVTLHEITATEIRPAIAEFGRAAELCERAGFDGVDVHGAQGFLISEFLSPLINQRTDEWGGSFENRVRFALEVVREVRRRTSPGFVVGFPLRTDELAHPTLGGDLRTLAHRRRRPRLPRRTGLTGAITRPLIDGGSSSDVTALAFAPPAGRRPANPGAGGNQPRCPAGSCLRR